MSEHDQFAKQIEVLVSSTTLHGSESLCKLLRYLGKHALEDPVGRVKEYQIATEVFGRRPDFDPQSDSMIRVQAGRLRAKLSEYYSTEGAHDRDRRGASQGHLPSPVPSTLNVWSHGAPGIVSMPRLRRFKAAARPITGSWRRLRWRSCWRLPWSDWPRC